MMNGVPSPPSVLRNWSDAEVLYSKVICDVGEDVSGGPGSRNWGKERRLNIQTCSNPHQEVCVR